jgi:hypothetical protein
MMLREAQLDPHFKDITTSCVLSTRITGRRCPLVVGHFEVDLRYPNLPLQ